MYSKDDQLYFTMHLRRDGLITKLMVWCFPKLPVIWLVKTEKTLKIG